MPKVKSYEDPRETALKDELGALVFRIGRHELARRSGIPYSTLCTKLHKVGSLTLSEYWRLQKAGERG